MTPLNSGDRHRTFETGGRAFRSLALLLLTPFIFSACSGSSSSAGGTDSGASDSGGSAPPSVSLSASSTLITSGQTVALSWSAQGANGCTASGGWSGNRGLSGTETVGPLTQDPNFTLSCSGDSGGSVRQVTVRIDDGDGASVQLSASPEYVEAGGTSTLTWNAPGATDCTASGGWSGSQPVSGSFTVGPVNDATTYQLSCQGPSGSGLAMVTINLADKTLRWQAPTENVDGSTLTDLAGYVIYWGTTSRSYSGSHTINSPTATQWEASMAPGAYYFAMTAFDAENNESGYSNEVLKVIP